MSIYRTIGPLVSNFNTDITVLYVFAGKIVNIIMLRVDRLSHSIA